MIVKILVLPNPPCAIVLDEKGKALLHTPLTAPLRARMAGMPRRHFKATLDDGPAGDGCLHLEDAVPDPGW